MTEQVFFRFDQLPLLSSVDGDSLVAVWEDGRLYAAPVSAVGAGGGPGASGYSTVRYNGADLTQRTTLEVTGILTAVDSGGRTLLNLSAIALASQVSGVLPIVNGGTGLSASGTTGQSLRYKADGSLEAYTPSAGLNAPASPADNGKVAVGSAGNLSYLLLTAAHLSPAAAIATTQLALMSAARLLGRDTGAGTPAELTVGGGIEFTGSGGLQRSAVTGDVAIAAGSNAAAIAAGAVTTAKIADANVTPAKLAAGTAGGQQGFWDGSAWRLFGLLTGTNLTDAAQTLAIAGGAQYILSAALTASRDKRLALAGASAGLMMTIYSIATRAFTMPVKDDAAGTTLFTFPASATPIVATFRMNDAGTAWTLSGWAPMAPVV